jgi:hypothetical protein
MKRTKNPNRRELLGTLGVLGALGISSHASSGEKSKDKVDAVTGPVIVTKADRQEYARLRNLDGPKVVAKQKKMPVGEIGNLTFGRLMSGRAMRLPGLSGSRDGTIWLTEEFIPTALRRAAMTNTVN